MEISRVLFQGSIRVLGMVAEHRSGGSQHREPVQNYWGPYWRLGGRYLEKRPGHLQKDHLYPIAFSCTYNYMARILLPRWVPYILAGA